jgi:7-cyano-7-deazaguanine tRNA-ribosyltransferase
MYLDLRKKACVFAKNINAKIFAIGGIVPLMNEYRYRQLIDIILTCKMSLPVNKPVHAFGVGHPISFALLACCGIDLFDSAIYSLAAEEDRYLTEYGTKHLSELQELPCSCEVCRKYSAEELREMKKQEREKLLAKHNLYITFEEIKRVRQAIREEALFELLQIRARTHPKLYEGFIYALKKYKKYFYEFDNFPKKRGLFYFGEESKLRPEILKARERLKRISIKDKLINKKPFGKVPKNLLPAYPFYQSEVVEEGKKEAKINWIKFLKLILEYQFGKGAYKNFKGIQLEIASTGKLRRVWKDGKLLGTISAETGFFLPSSEGAKLLESWMKKVFVKKEAEEFVRKGKNVLAKFAFTSEEVLPGEEVLICSEKGEIIACGKALLNKEEINSFERGVAVKVRDWLRK